jgi:hypothetical protein
MDSTKPTPIHLLVTTAQIDKHKKARTKEYEESFKIFNDMGYHHPYIVEGVQAQGPSILEQFTDPDKIYYYPTNKPEDKNRGKFEGLSIAAALKQFKLDPQSIIYKQTGRYKATRDLANIVKEYPTFDAYVRYGEQEYILLAAYLWKCEKLLQMFESLDYQAMEATCDPRNPIPTMIETYVTNYVKQQEQEKKLTVYYFQEKLGVLANPSNSGTGLTMDSPTEY